MLRFTSSGVVETPRTVQLRVTRVSGSRVVAGAPRPSRDLDDAEIEANLRWFVEELRGPRTTPCTAAVLSGQGLAGREGLAEILGGARRAGLERVTLHMGAQEVGALRDAPLREALDAVAIAVSSVEDLDAAGPLASLPAVTVVVPLDEAMLVRLAPLVARLAVERPARVVLCWPLPPAPPPPDASRWAPLLEDALARLEAAGVPGGVKGLPPCALGARSDRHWRTGNRWYVDADHQRDRALLFLPDLVRFAKSDGCRFCRLDPRCDGAPRDWLERGIVGVLRPVR